MKRCFKLTNDSQLIKDYERYKTMDNNQRNFVDKFSNEKGIESNVYYVSGDGTINQPFTEFWKSRITLSIDPTENDINKFDKMLTVPNKHHGLRTFKKSSVIAKEFSQKCIDEKIVINLHKPRVGDYFNSIRWGGCRSQLFNFDGQYYLMVESDNLDEKEIPEEFTEIKLSEYYLALENLKKEDR